MRTGWCYDARFLLHKTGEHHPERPERLRAITARLGDEGLLARLTPLIFGPADRRWIETTHAPAYIDRVRAACLGGQPYIDSADSAICKESFDVALLAVGAVLASADAVMSGQVDNAFCAVRPPGHHAERDLSMGFCLFNNVAIAARYLQQRWSVPRVLILDWDVHHGNGTQHAFEEDPSVLFCSFHEHPAFLYPGTGFEEEIGRGAAAGRTLNIAMRPGAGDAEYQQVFTLKFVPAARAFHPDFILVSAGFDAHEADPLASLRLHANDYTWATSELAAIANECCRGRVVSTLEGGYDLHALADSAAAHVRALMTT